MRVARSVLWLAAACAIGGTVAFVARAKAPATSPGCAGLTTGILVDTGAHRLLLCESGKSVASFVVRIGHNGVGKKHAGDGRTPLGSYPLGQPRGSKKYGEFVPVGYPTVTQKNAGYTGSDIGVHGPDRRARWLGALANTFDTTDGCVGVATDAEMKRIVAWISKTGAAEIVLR